MSMAMVGAVVLFGMAAYAAGSAHLFAPSPLAAADSGCQTFAQTGHTVCGDFLVYWQTNGGLAQQGYPISDVFDEKSETDGITHKVQYFERAVFEMHPENQPPNNVLLSLLGSQKYKAKYGDKPPVASQAPPAAVTPPQPPITTSGSLALISSGYGQQRTELGYGFIVMNTDSGNELDDSRYQVAAYDAAGTVIKTDSGHISALLPNQRLGIAGKLYLPEGAMPARLDVQLSAGTKKPHAPATFPLIVSNIKFQPDQYSPRITGVVANADATDAKRVFLYVVAYDAGGKIVGSGLGLVDFIPANGQSAIEAAVTIMGTPARFEVYPAYL